jgi:hypothetical protein
MRAARAVALAIRQKKKPRHAAGLLETLSHRIGQLVRRCPS